MDDPKETREALALLENPPGEILAVILERLTDLQKQIDVLKTLVASTPLAPGISNITITAAQPF